MCGIIASLTMGRSHSNNNSTAALLLPADDTILSAGAQLRNVINLKRLELGLLWHVHKRKSEELKLKLKLKMKLKLDPSDSRSQMA